MTNGGQQRRPAANPHSPRLATSRRYARWLWLLVGLFAARVLAQPATFVIEASWLPRFESWQGSNLPYPVLLATQLVILALLARIAFRFTIGAVAPRRRTGVWLLSLGGVYFVAMLARLVLGATVLSTNQWLAKPLPTFFHLVLASFVLLAGYYHYRHEPRSRF